MLERNFHPNKVRNIVDYTGKIYDDEYVMENELESDFCLTINDIANILDLAIPTVQTYIIPRVDVAVAGEYIRGYMENNRLKRVVSKSSLIDFLGWYINVVDYDCDTYAISKWDSKKNNDDLCLEHILITEIHSILENAKRIQPFLNFSSQFLEDIHFADYSISEEEKEIRVRDCVKSVLEHNVLSFNQIKAKKGFNHNEQVVRHLKKKAHIKLRLNSLDTTGSAKKDNVRYILKDNINILDGEVVEKISLEHGKPYFINVFDKTKSALKNLETEQPVYIVILHIILENINDILPKFETWEKENKRKKEKNL